MIAFSIATCRCSSVTPASILLVSALLRVAKASPLQDVTWSVITWALLKGSTRGRCEECHVAVGGLAPSPRRDRDDTDRDVVGKQSESPIGRPLWREPVRDPVVDELRQDLLDDLLADPGDGDRAARAGVQSRADDRRIPDPAPEQ